jgi:branched-subunit amino acid transport protein AzlD
MMSFVMGLVILFCRALPFFFSRRSEDPPPPDRSSPEPARNGKSPIRSLAAFAEKVAPPVAMTVLAFNAIGASIREDPRAALPVLAASALTAGLHLWRRNALISILGGTVLYMVLAPVW